MEKRDNDREKGQATRPSTENMQKNTSELNSSNGKQHRLLTTIAAIFILAASLFGGHFFQDDSGIPSNKSDIQEDTAYKNEQEIKYTFRNDTYLAEHFEKHGKDFTYSSKEEYLAGANRVIASDDALHKLEAEDGDDVYYLEASNEFVIVSTDGFIRTYFKPEGGIAYYNRQ